MLKVERLFVRSDYLKLCGQRFWEFISGDENLYTEIIEPLGHKAKEKNEQFAVEYVKVVNRFTREFATEYCDGDGSILWKKLVEFNSGKSSNNKSSRRKKTTPLSPSFCPNSF